MRDQRGKRKVFTRTVWMKILACIVALATIYALHLPAATLDEDAAATEPGLVLETKEQQDSSDRSAGPPEQPGTAESIGSSEHCACA